MKNSFVEQAYQTVVRHMEDESFDVADFCLHMAVSRTQLHRRLKAEKNMSATRFINYVRIEEAKDQLRNTGLSISEIGYACGFRHISTFNRVFRNSVGMAPSQYRRMHGNGPKPQR